MRKRNQIEDKATRAEAPKTPANAEVTVDFHERRRRRSVVGVYLRQIKTNRSLHVVWKRRNKRF